MQALPQLYVPACVPSDTPTAELFSITASSVAPYGTRRGNEPGVQGCPVTCGSLVVSTAWHVVQDVNTPGHDVGYGQHGTGPSKFLAASRSGPLRLLLRVPRACGRLQRAPA